MPILNVHVFNGERKKLMLNDNLQAVNVHAVL